MSEFQGKINWNLVKTDADFAFVRAGFTMYSGGLNLDARFFDNMDGAVKAGVPAGVYVYAYDRTPEAARESAKEVLRQIENCRVEYPVAYDFEAAQYRNYTKQQNAEIAAAFLEEMESAGYFAMLYANTNFLLNYLDLARLAPYAVWVADYRDPSGEKCPYPGPFSVWQYRGGKGNGDGRCAGIEGYCDRDLDYVGLGQIIQKAGLNHLNGETEPPDTDEEPDTDVPPDGGGVPDTDKEPDEKPNCLVRFFRAVVHFFEDLFL